MDLYHSSGPSQLVDSNTDHILRPAAWATPWPHGSSYTTPRRIGTAQTNTTAVNKSTQIALETTQQVRRTIYQSTGYISRTRSTKLDQNKKYNRREGWPDLHWNPTTIIHSTNQLNSPLPAYYTMVEVKEAGYMWMSRRIGPDFRWKSHCRDRTPTTKPWYSSLNYKLFIKQ